MSYDIIIKNGRIIDGTGNPYYHAEMGIKDGEIEKIRPKLKFEAVKEIDASGLVVCPGFIDIHSHTDLILPFYRKMDSAIRQGITTTVGGMCGEGLAPVHPDKVEEFKEIFHNFLPIGMDFKLDWFTFEEYLKKLEKLRCPGNLALLVGYKSIRLAGGAGFENRPPTPKELEKMREYISEAMIAGAFGMSTGLIYAPQIYASIEELIELAKVVADYNGLYFSHIRSEGETLVKAVKEFIEIVEKSGCVGGQIAHHKVAGKIYWGASKETLQLIEEANARGLSITFDQYPYTRSMTTLVTALPPWVHEGGIEKILERLQNPIDKERIKKDIQEGIEGWENMIYDNGFGNIYLSLTKTEKWRDVKGLNISEITKLKGKSDDFETFFEILIDENTAVLITIEGQSEEDLRRIMTNRYQMVGTDGMGIPNIPSIGSLHPRFYGVYPRVLGKYVREERLLNLEEAIRKMTSFPAQRLGLKDRGLLAEGMWADIVVLNPDTVIDKATYEQCHQYPEGIPFVIVNGVIVVDNNKQLRKFPGKVLRRPT